MLLLPVLVLLLLMLVLLPLALLLFRLLLILEGPFLRDLDGISIESSNNVRLKI